MDERPVDPSAHPPPDDRIAGYRLNWPFTQPSRQGSTTYAVEVPNVATPTDPLGPFPFSATVQYKNTLYPSPDPEVVFEPGGN